VTASLRDDQQRSAADRGVVDGPVRIRFRRSTVLAWLAGTVMALGGLGWGLVSTRPSDTGARPTLVSVTTRRPPLDPPVIVEPFTLLACNGETTLGMEGCLEHRIVALDHRIDADVALLFRLLPTDGARRRLVAAQEAWVSYRLADCRSQADANAGGTLAGVDAAACELRDSTARRSDLLAFDRNLEQGQSGHPAFP